MTRTAGQDYKLLKTSIQRQLACVKIVP